MQPLASLVALLLLCYAEAALDLPSYLKACNRDDPKFNDCALKSAVASIPKLIQGDRKYNIPRLDPLEIVEIVVNTGGTQQAGLELTFQKAKFIGLKNAVIKAVKFETPKKHAEVKIFVPILEILSQYTVSGKILVLPITGNGNCNVTLVDLVFDVGIDWNSEKKSDGLEYLKITKSTINYDLKKAYFKLDNLFNGNKLLGDNMNKFLNENWQDVIKEVGPAVANALSLVVKQILEGITNLVPYNNIFPTKS